VTQPTNTAPVWKSRRGEIPLTEMVTVHIKNAIATVEGELAQAVVAERTAKETILAALKAEFATRSDAA
jgi:hypothetical protein